MSDYNPTIVEANEAFGRLFDRNEHGELEPQVWHLTTHAFTGMDSHGRLRLDYAKQLAEDLSALPTELQNALFLAEKAHAVAVDRWAVLLLTIDASEQGIGDPEPGYVFNEAARAAESTLEAFKMQAKFEVARVEWDNQ